MCRYLTVLLISLCFSIFMVHGDIDCGKFGWELVKLNGNTFQDAQSFCGVFFKGGIITIIDIDDAENDLEYAQISLYLQHPSNADIDDVWIQDGDKCGFINNFGEFTETDCGDPSITKKAVICTSSDDIDPCDLFEEDLSNAIRPDPHVRLAMVSDYQIERDNKIYPETRWFGTQRPLGITWVPGDVRRSQYGSDNLKDLTIAFDETQPAVIDVDGVLVPVDGCLDAVKLGALDWFDSTGCAGNVKFEVVEASGDIGHDNRIPPTLDNQVADITFDGFVPRGANRYTLGRAYFWTFTDENGEDTDINNDGFADFAFAHIRLNGKYWFFDWSVDGETAWDIYTIALHEFGHALGLGHWGNFKLFRNEDGEVVRRVMAPSSIMAPFYDGQQSGLHGSDIGAFCSLFGEWGSLP